LELIRNDTPTPPVVQYSSFSGEVETNVYEEPVKELMIEPDSKESTPEYQSVPVKTLISTYEQGWFRNKASLFGFSNKQNVKNRPEINGHFNEKRLFRRVFFLFLAVCLLLTDCEICSIFRNLYSTRDPNHVVDNVIINHKREDFKVLVDINFGQLQWCFIAATKRSLGLHTSAHSEARSAAIFGSDSTAAAIQCAKPAAAELLAVFFDIDDSAELLAIFIDSTAAAILVVIVVDPQVALAAVWRHCQAIRSSTELREQTSSARSVTVRQQDSASSFASTRKDTNASLRLTAFGPECVTSHAWNLEEADPVGRCSANPTRRSRSVIPRLDRIIVAQL